MLTPQQHQQAARALYDAELTQVWTTPVSLAYPDATVADAYQIAREVAALKVAAGRAVKGHKVGLTSEPMRRLVNATEPDYGFLFDDRILPEGSVIPASVLNHPLVEVELAFVLAAPLRGPMVNVADVIRAVDVVIPALEIVDSRYNARGRALLIDSISDAASCGFAVLGGNPARLTDIDVRQIGVSLAVNGTVVEKGASGAVMDNPLNAVAWLANKLAEYGVAMEPGQVIMSGSCIRAAQFGAGDRLVAEYDEFGRVEASVSALPGATKEQGQ